MSGGPVNPYTLTFKVLLDSQTPAPALTLPADLNALQKHDGKCRKGVRVGCDPCEDRECLTCLVLRVAWRQ